MKSRPTFPGYYRGNNCFGLPGKTPPERVAASAYEKCHTGVDSLQVPASASKGSTLSGAAGGSMKRKSFTEGEGQTDEEEFSELDRFLQSQYHPKEDRARSPEQSEDGEGQEKLSQHGPSPKTFSQLLDQNMQQPHPRKKVAMQKQAVQEAAGVPGVTTAGAVGRGKAANDSQLSGWTSDRTANRHTFPRAEEVLLVTAKARRTFWQITLASVPARRRQRRRSCRRKAVSPRTLPFLCCKGRRTLTRRTRQTLN